MSLLHVHEIVSVIVNNVSFIPFYPFPCRILAD